MKRKRSVILAVLLLVLSLPVSVGAAPASNGVTLETEHFREFDITLPEALAEKYRWEETGFEGTNVLNFYDRGLYDATDETAISAQTRGYRFSISQYYYDSDYCGMADLEPHEMFQSSLNRIVAFYSRDDMPQQLMLLAVEYTLAPSAETERDVLEIVGCMTPKSDIRLEDIDANPWNVKFANFLLNGQFRTAGQEYFDKIERQACLYNVAGNNYPELIITNGASGYAVAAYVYTLNANGQVEYLRTATEAELGAMPMQSFSSIYSTGWGDFLTACGYKMQYLGGADDTAGWLGTYRYDDGAQGELYIVKESNDSEVRGEYVFREASGEYDSRDFVWSKDDSSTASEPFQNGTGSDRIVHYLKDDRIVTDYPDGWWPDRDYVRVSDAEHSDSEEEETGIPVSYAGATVDFKESLFEKSAYEYDNELATLGAMLSCAVEKSEQDTVDLLQKIGVDGCGLHNIEKNEMFAFAVAHKEMRLNGEDAVVLFVIARGTANPYEAFSDAMNIKDPFFNYTAYDYAYRFYLRINDGISEYIGKYPDLLDKPLKVFVTGHSLGGAGANLVAANFTLYEWWGNYLSNEDVFAYTYGAIDSIDVKTPVVDGYGNIHNIYNFYDTFGPNGWPIFTASGNSGKGKFGHIDQFGHPYTTNPFSCDNHLIENYLSSIVEGAISCKHPYFGSSVWCPVDVEVLKNGEVVGRITDNQVDEELLAANPEVALMVVEDSKHIAVFDSPEAYSLRITATDDGKMSVSTVSFDDSGESYGAAEYPDVEIKTGQVFSVELPDPNMADGKEQTPELLVMDGNRISGKVNPDGSISPVNGTGNWLQLALLAAVAILGVLITFLGGRKMKETKKLKFPIASIFAVILAFGLLTNLYRLRVRSGWMDSKIGYRMVVEFGGTYSVFHILYQVLLIGSMILLAVLLFMRKRNSLLAGALAIQALLPAFTLTSFLLNCGSRGFFDVYEYELHFGPMMWAIGICGCYVLEILCYLLLTLMTITPCAGDGEHKRGLHRLWFLPGILGIFIAFAHLVGNIYFMRSDLYCLSVLFLIPMAFLLGWWLTHPYKKERPVYQMPVTQPYGQPVYQSVGTFDAAQKVNCSGCGRELLPDEMFCAGCGTRRPEPSRAEPDTANQKVFCSGCGRELPPDEDFCCVCGTRRPNLLQDETIDL